MSQGIKPPPFAHYTNESRLYAVRSMNALGSPSNHTVESALLPQVPQQQVRTYRLAEAVSSCLAWPSSPGKRMYVTHRWNKTC